MGSQIGKSHRDIGKWIGEIGKSTHGIGNQVLADPKRDEMLEMNRFVNSEKRTRDWEVDRDIGKSTAPNPAKRYEPIGKSSNKTEHVRLPNGSLGSRPKKV